ncbi:superinfection exclusion B family protein [Aeromonas sanarellii]|uniref:superinfection exclusion B family protein n=1 Tax=Aeromonas TaxID=642 RepID=UPI002DB79F4F|nr:superinfection exclusion B family protein [Aeromonas sanarellii]MEB6606891.1 superinfection exclusion B family protein [Aeromonas sanarellii]
MKRWIQHFYQLNRLNWLMVWLLLCCSIILLFPAGLMKGAVSQWATAHAAWLGVGMLIAISYFCSQGFLIAWEWACDEWQSRRQQDQLAQMIEFLDFNEKAVLREFVLQRKSVINLPITEPAVKNLMDAGVLTYAYGKPVREKEDENQIRALMIALPARPLLTYKVLGLSRGKMSDEQVEQIMNARPKFAQKSFQR